jgi:hypothetical protein
MTPIIENASLSTDLDCQFKDLLNVLHFYPVPGKPGADLLIQGCPIPGNMPLGR